MYELLYVGTCSPPRGTGRAFGGPIDPQFARGTVFPLVEGERLVLGRVQDAGLRIESPIVARHHGAVRLEVTGASAVLRVEDLGGGMFSRGLYIRDHARLAPGDVFEVGGVLVFQFRAAGAP